MLERDVDFRARSPFQTDVDFILWGIDLHGGIFELRSQKALGDERLFYCIEIFAEKIASERPAGLKLESRPDGTDVKRRIDCELTHAGLSAGRDGIDHYAPRAADVGWIWYLAMLNGGVIVATITEVGLNVIGVAFDCLHRKAAPGLEQIQTRADFVSGDWRSGRRPEVQRHAGNYNLALDDETDPNRTGSPTPGLSFNNFNSRRRYAARGEEIV